MTANTVSKALRLFEVARVADISADKKDVLEKAILNIQKSIFEESPYWAIPKAYSEIVTGNKLESSDKSDNLPRLKSLLSSFLLVEESFIEKLIKGDLEYIADSKYRQEDLIETLFKFQKDFFRLRANKWQLLQEFLRVDMDPTHSFHSIASKNVKSLIDGGLVDHCLRHFNKLGSWVFTSFKMDPQGMNASLALMQNVSYSHRRYWVEEYVEEINRLLDVLMLITYNRAPLDGTQLYQLINGVGNEFLLLEDAGASLKQIQCKFMLLIAESFQFWRYFKSPKDFSELPKHQLVADLEKDKGSKLSSSLKQLKAAESLICPKQVVEVLQFLSNCFTEFNTSNNSKSSRAIEAINNSDQNFEIESITETILSLAKVTMNDTSLNSLDKQTQSSGEASNSQYYLIFQEILNAYIKYRCLQAHICHVDMMFISESCEIAYAGDEAYCRLLLEIWQSPDSRDCYPLIKLIYWLAETTPHIPSYLLKILKTLTSSGDLIILVCDILNNSTSYVSSEEIGNLRLKSENAFLSDEDDEKGNLSFDRLEWEKGSPEILNPEPGVRVQYDKDALSSSMSRINEFWGGGHDPDNEPFTINLFAHRLDINRAQFEPLQVLPARSICTPAYGSEGVVLEFDPSDKMCLVRWDSKFPWWIIIVQLILDYFSLGNACNQVQQSSVFAALDLIAHITSNEIIKTHVMRSLNSRWIEVSLYLVLKSLDFDCDFSGILSAYRMASIGSVSTNLLLNILDSYGMDTRRLLYINNKLQVSVYCLPLVDIMGKSIASLLLQAAKPFLFDFQTPANELNLQNIVSALNMARISVTNNNQLAPSIIFALASKTNEGYNDFRFSTLFTLFTNVKENPKVLNEACLFAHSLLKAVIQSIQSSRCQTHAAASSSTLVAMETCALDSSKENELKIIGRVYAEELCKYSVAMVEELASVFNTNSIKISHGQPDLPPLVSFCGLLRTLLLECHDIIHRSEVIKHFSNGGAIQSLLKVALCLPTFAVVEASRLDARDSSSKTRLRDIISLSFTEEKKTIITKQLRSLYWLVDSKGWSVSLMKTILLASVSCLDLLMMMMQVGFSENDSSIVDCTINLLSMSSYSASLAGTKKGSKAVDSNAVSLLGCLILLTITEFGPICQLEAVQVRLSAAKFVNYLIPLIPSTSPMKSWILNTLGAKNILPFCSLILKHLGTATVTNSSDESIALWEMLWRLMEYHPIIFGLVFGLESLQSPEKSLGDDCAKDLVKQLLSIVDNSGDIYKEKPLLLVYSYRFLKAMILKSHAFPRIAKNVLNIVQSPKLWKALVSPLKDELPVRPTRDLFNLSQQKIGHNRPNLSYRDIIDKCESPDDIVREAGVVLSSDSDYLALKDKVLIYTQQMLVIGVSLDILALERFGGIYHLNSSIAQGISDEVDSIFVSLNVKARFIGWTKTYMNVYDNSVTIGTLKMKSQELGWSYEELRDPLLHSLGFDFSLNAKPVHTAVLNLATKFVTEELEVSPLKLETIGYVANIANLVARFNLESMLTMTDLQVLRSWKDFLETFVLPGSNIKQYLSSLSKASSSSSSPAVETFSKTPSKQASLDSSKSSSLSLLGAIGTLSPVTNQPDASPVSQRESTFSGDKRSYEVVTELLKTLITSYPEENLDIQVPMLLGMLEKCELLMAMLHHQLKSVSYKDADPSKSDVKSRDIGSARLTQAKMEELLERVLQYYERVFPTEVDLQSLTSSEACISQYNPHQLVFEQSNNYHAQIKSMVRSKFLTIILLLLTSINAFNGTDDSHSKHGERRRTAFASAAKILHVLVHSYGLNVFIPSQSHQVKDSSHAKEKETLRMFVLKSGVTTPQVLSKICLQIIVACLPNGMGLNRDVSASDHMRWIALMKETKITQFLTGAMSALIEQVASNPTLRKIRSPLSHNQSERLLNSNQGIKCFDLRAMKASTVADSFAGAAGASSLAPSTTAAASTAAADADASVESEINCIIAFMDLSIKILNAHLIDISSDGECFTALIELMKRNSILKVFQDSLSAWDSSFAGILMGYDDNGSENILLHYFKRCLKLVESILTSLKSDGSTPLSPQQLEYVNTFLTLLLQQFEQLFLYPLIVPATYRLSLQQIELIGDIYHFFSVMNSFSPLWKVHLPAVYKLVYQTCSELVSRWTLLLWHGASASASSGGGGGGGSGGEEKSSEYQHLRILSHMAAISIKEERMLVSNAPHLNGGSEDLKDHEDASSRHVRFGSNQTFVVGQSPVSKDSGLGFNPRSILKQHGDVSVSVSDRDVCWNGYLFTLESAMLSSLLHVIKFVRQGLPTPFDVRSKDLYPVGSLVYYVSEHTGGLCCGIIIKVASNGESVDVRHFSGLVEELVRLSQVRYTSPPWCAFKPLTDIHQRDLDILVVQSDESGIHDSSRSSSSSHLKTSQKNLELSTAHLYRCLLMVCNGSLRSRVIVSGSSALVRAQVDHTLHSLAQELSYILIATMDHQSLAAFYIDSKSAVEERAEAVMIQQIQDIQKLLYGTRTGDVKRMRSLSGSFSEAILAGPGSSSGIDGEWFNSKEWCSYVDFMEHWCEEIFYRLNISLGVSFPVHEYVAPERERKKRVGLRAKIDWVHSVEDI